MDYMGYHDLFDHLLTPPRDGQQPPATGRHPWIRRLFFVRRQGTKN
ncbi:hypothetical protein EDC39_11711 [Geothermobacter ehrlichii]|uniref:Uncharacterized protein n=1 Tax=Geothermobacter ehrlichii TaxID=213224 RepID=A0A5D3WGN7_9BACT|nr:hypothetical protein [Geothermobacter ehrlichii]TYO95754.1 hypothetical protein EDC39_11711 [Geothermobacter ehrlichii]